ncbi:MAG: hypothetical protein JJE39_09425 [Vicinamibacteria bacterium]|nr:hypothetical protein [Vicinamibacteria bacterium]
MNRTAVALAVLVAGRMLRLLLLGAATFTACPHDALVWAQSESRRPRPEAASGGILFEEDDRAATWSGAWSSKVLAQGSGAGARLAMDKGAQASFSFTGVSVSWIGYRDEWSGLADVLLDGTLQATVDTYSEPAQAQATLYTVAGLREGPHTLTIQVRGTHNPASAGSWIWIDAFLVAPSSGPSPLDRSDSHRSRRPAASEDQPARSSWNPKASIGRRGEDPLHFEEDNAAATWSGAWSTNRLAAHSGHRARLSMDSSSRVDFAFTGNGVTWLGYRDEWSGIADVLLDGRLRATVDTYSTPAQPQAVLYAVSGLRDGPHTLTIRPTGRRHPSSGGAWIWVDGFLSTR